MPSTADGARKNGKWLGGEEVASKHCGETSILHTHLDGDGTLLGGIEACELSGEPSEEITQSVVAEYHGESPEEKHQATSHQVIMNSGDNTSYDEGKARYAHTRHQTLDSREAFLLAIDVVESATDGNWDDSDDEDVDEHAHSIHMDNFACRNLHQQWSHHWGENRRGASHAHRESHVAMAEITHDIARYTARAASYEQYAECQGRVKMPYVNQSICHARHDDELGASSDEDIQWALCQNLEIVGGQCQSHGEHDDAKDDGLGSSSHPVEGMWEEECEYCYTYNKE